jgi:hypothetical protein
MFWRQSETRDFARLFISKCQVIRVTDEEKAVSRSNRPLAQWRNADLEPQEMTWHFKSRPRARRVSREKTPRSKGIEISPDSRHNGCRFRSSPERSPVVGPQAAL